MPTGVEHYQDAEQLLAEAAQVADTVADRGYEVLPVIAALTARARVHAELAVAAAWAVAMLDGMPGTDADLWQTAAGYADGDQAPDGGPPVVPWTRRDEADWEVRRALHERVTAAEAAIGRVRALPPSSAGKLPPATVVVPAADVLAALVGDRPTPEDKPPPLFAGGFNPAAPPDPPSWPKDGI